MAKLYRLIEYEYDEHDPGDFHRTLERSLPEGARGFGNLSIRVRTIKPVADVYSVVICHTDRNDQEQITNETFIPETALGTFVPNDYEVAKRLLEGYRANKRDYHRAELVRMLIYLPEKEAEPFTPAPPSQG